MTDLLANQVNLTIASTAARRALYQVRPRRCADGDGQAAPAAVSEHSIIRRARHQGPGPDHVLAELARTEGNAKPVVDKVYEALVASYKVDALREKIIATGQRPVASTPEAFTARIESDLKLYGEIFKAANIKIEQ